MVRNRRLATQAGQLFEQQFPVRMTAPPEMRGSMVSLHFGHFADAAERAPRLRLALHERGIVAPVSALDGHVYLRLSAQIYNEMADYSSCASALAGLGLVRRS
jgi:isopenicillin-N epimerase